MRASRTPLPRTGHSSNGITQFWTNHFAVSIDKIAVLGIAGAMEREAIRPNVTGSFTRLLMAVEKHPAMLLYLDNQTSIGPNSRAARFLARRGKGSGRKVDINENLAREILELHTLGVDGGYTQADVTTFAQAISGWSIGGEDQGPALRAPRRRQRQARRILLPRGFPRARRQAAAGQELRRRRREAGRGHPERPGAAAAKPRGTSRPSWRGISSPMIRRQRRSSALTHAWLDSRGNLPQRLRGAHRIARGLERAAGEVQDAGRLHSTLLIARSAIPLREKRRALQPFEALGQRNLMPGSPAGWPDTSADWDGSSALLKRIAWADAVAQRMGDAAQCARAGAGNARRDAERRPPRRPSRVPKAARRR